MISIDMMFGFMAGMLFFEAWEDRNIGYLIAGLILFIIALII